MTWQGKVPFRGESPLVYVDAYEERQGRVAWRDNDPFSGTMRLLHITRGKSAARFVWEDERGTKHHMFMADMLDLLSRSTVTNGYADGTWAFRKRGQNYGLALVSGKEADE